MRMSRFTLRFLTAASILTVAVVAAALSQQAPKKAPPEQEQKPLFAAITIRDGCMHNSYEPEVYSFYGSPETVSKKLNRFEMGLFDRRVFMFLVESEQSAEIVLYERPKSDKTGPFSVFRWGLGKSDAKQRVSDIRQRATDAILVNKGFDCIGKIVTDFVLALEPEKASEKQPAPESAVDALDKFKRFQGQYIRVTTFILC